MEENQNKNINKNNNNCIFSFAKLNKYYIIPFLCPIFCMSCNFFILKINDDKGVINKEFLLSILECLCFTGGGLLYFISSLREKTEETRDKAKTYTENKNTIKLIYNEYNDKTKMKKNYIKVFSMLFFMSLLVSLFTICEIYTFDKNIFEERFYIIFSIPIFSRIILRENIYNHQILSLSISFSGFILLFIPTILVITKEDININILFFFASIGLSLFLVLIKYVTLNYYISPYFCLLFVGIVSTLLTFIYFLIYSLILYNDLSFITNSFDFSNLETGKWFLLFIILIYIFGSLLETFSFLVNYYFSPTLLMVTDVISPFLLWLFNLFFKEETKLNIIFLSSGYIIVLISSLIYNEIVICNFCNLNKYTKKSLEERQNKETALLKKTEMNSSNFTENNDNNENNNENENENDTSYSEVDENN